MILTSGLKVLQSSTAGAIILWKNNRSKCMLEMACSRNSLLYSSIRFEAHSLAGDNLATHVFGPQRTGLIVAFWGNDRSSLVLAPSPRLTPRPRSRRHTNLYLVIWHNAQFYTSNGPQTEPVSSLISRSANATASEFQIHSFCWCLDGSNCSC